MLISIRKVFFNFKTALLLLGIGITILCIQLMHISQYSERLSALKNQHLLIEKIINTDLTDPKMASILIHGAVSEISLSVKLSGRETFLDSFITSNEEQASLLRSLDLSSKTFSDNALSWSKAPTASDIEHSQMLNARAPYLLDIDRMFDYQIHILNESIATANMTALLLFITGGIVFIFYRHRLNQIYRDIDQACSVDIDGIKKEVLTQEIDFILKRLIRKSSQQSSHPNLINPLSGLNNEKGLATAFSNKKSARSGNTIFMTLFEIDHYSSLVNTLSKEDIGAIYKKLGDMISMYEQALDIIAHLENDTIVFLMSRNTKQAALQDSEQIIQSVQESSFITEQGPIKITLSGAFLLKIPSKSIEDTIEEATRLVQKAKENGGNRIAQLRDHADSYR
ncbi:MAG: diguanylate cyclase [Sulfuricurvum sp.]|nr:diguanylate cyclase [Sulfuricurvum sp.]